MPGPPDRAGAQASEATASGGKVSLPSDRRAATILLPLPRILVYLNAMNEVAPSSSLPARGAGAPMGGG